MPSRPRPPHLPADLCALAAAQDGLVTVAQLAAAGIGSDGVRSLRRAGVARTVMRGVLALGAEPADPVTRLRAALLAVPTGTLCLDSAAALHGLPTPAGHDSRPHLSVPPEATRTQCAGLRLHWLELDSGDVSHGGGLPVTSPRRLVLDASRRWEREPFVALLDAAYRQGLVQPVDVAELGTRLPRRARAWAALADGNAESPLETHVRLLLVDAGLGAWLTLQHPLVTPSGRFVARLDLAIVPARLGIECDGRDVHELPAALFRDRHRDDDVRSLGWRLLRVTGRDVRTDPGGIVRRVRRALTEAG